MLGLNSKMSVKLVLFDLAFLLNLSSLPTEEGIQCVENVLGEILV